MDGELPFSMMDVIVLLDSSLSAVGPGFLQHQLPLL